MSNFKNGVFTKKKLKYRIEIVIGIIEGGNLKPLGMLPPHNWKLPDRTSYNFKAQTSGDGQT